MTSHELAQMLLEAPDLPVATHANNHTDTYGPLRVGIMRRSKLDAGSAKVIIIGNLSRRELNFDSQYVESLLDGGTLPENWPR